MHPVRQVPRTRRGRWPGFEIEPEARSALYAPLAWVIIGGLLSSTLLARLVTPVVYKLLAPAVDPLETIPASSAM